MAATRFEEVNNVMGRTSDWRDDSTHKGEDAVVLKWEDNRLGPNGMQAQLDRLLPQLQLVKGFVSCWVSKPESTGPGVYKMCVKLDATKLSPKRAYKV